MMDNQTPKKCATSSPQMNEMQGKGTLTNVKLLRRCTSCHAVQGVLGEQK